MIKFVKIFLQLIVLLLIYVSAEGARPTWFDQSHEALLPPNVENKLLNYRDFPAFWWNFMILEFDSETEIDIGLIRTVCSESFKDLGNSLKRSPCNFLDSSTQLLLQEWSTDYIRRHPKPPEEEVQKKYNEALAKASLPLEPEFLKILRTDPYNSLEEFKNIFLNKKGFSFENHQGILVDSVSKRVLIPIQINATPTDVSKLTPFFEKKDDICKTLKCKRSSLLGPHFSSWENETQVKSDVRIVSVVGSLVFFIFMGFFAYLKKYRLLLLFGPLLVAIVLGAGVTIYIFGKIHGLTLAFGPSIVGLAMDFGLHGAFTRKEERGIWRANFFGLLTTLSIFVVILFSDLPLLKQIATFSIAGLSFGFLLFFLFKQVAPAFFHEEPFKWEIKKSKVLNVLALLFLLFGMAAPLLLRPDFSLQLINFEQEQTKELRAWLYKSGQTFSPIMSISKGDSDSVFKNLVQQKEWSQKESIEFENAAKYLLSSASQKENIDSWRDELCKNKRSEVVNVFFEPYFNQINCDNLLPKGLINDGTSPLYVGDLETNRNFITIWFPKSNLEQDKIRNQYPSSSSFADIIFLFSKTLTAEYKWMVPVAFLISIVLLIIYFHSMKASLFALIPFFAGLGCYTLCCYFLRLDVSFISMIGLIMMYGFSVDYGIFVVNLLYFKETDSAHGVWTSVNLSAATTILGFAPLIFAHHPALRHLGQSLFLGSVGTYIGTAWGIPWIYNMFKMDSKKGSS